MAEFATDDIAFLDRLDRHPGWAFTPEAAPEERIRALAGFLRHYSSRMGSAAEQATWLANWIDDHADDTDALDLAGEHLCALIDELDGALAYAAAELVLALRTAAVTDGNGSGA